MGVYIPSAHSVVTAASAMARTYSVIIYVHGFNADWGLVRSTVQFRRTGPLQTCLDSVTTIMKKGRGKYVRCSIANNRQNHERHRERRDGDSELNKTVTRLTARMAGPTVRGIIILCIGQYRSMTGTRREPVWPA